MSEIIDKHMSGSNSGGKLNKYTASTYMCKQWL